MCTQSFSGCVVLSFGLLKKTNHENNHPRLNSDKDPNLDNLQQVKQNQLRNDFFSLNLIGLTESFDSANWSISFYRPQDNGQTQIYSLV